MATDRQIRPEWDDDAERLLAKSDRLMGAAIKQEFNRNPKGPTSTEIDAVQHLYTTSVAGNMYTVLWVLEKSAEGDVARVKAVVPAQFSETDVQAIKRQVSAFGSAELGRVFELS